MYSKLTNELHRKLPTLFNSKQAMHMEENPQDPDCIDVYLNHSIGKQHKQLVPQPMVVSNDNECKHDIIVQPNLARVKRVVLHSLCETPSVPKNIRFNGTARNATLLRKILDKNLHISALETQTIKQVCSGQPVAETKENKQAKKIAQQVMHKYNATNANQDEIVQLIANHKHSCKKLNNSITIANKREAHAKRLEHVAHVCMNLHMFEIGKGPMIYPEKNNVEMTYNAK